MSQIPEGTRTFPRLGNQPFAFGANDKRPREAGGRKVRGVSDPADSGIGSRAGPSEDAEGTLNWWPHRSC